MSHSPRIRPLAGALALGLACLGGLSSSRALEGEKTAPVTALSVFPEKVALEGARDLQRLVVQARLEDGTTRDVSSEVSSRVEPADRVHLREMVLTPREDGEAVVYLVLGDQELRVPVVVQDSRSDPPLSFGLDILPVLSKSGCNTGPCHGSARGKDGFQLSLFGYDPAGDYHRLTRELSGRRINLAEPGRSLVLTKGTGAVPHTGGKLFPEDGEFHSTVRRWLAEGARPDPADGPRPLGIEVYPPSSVLEGPGGTQQIVVIARYSDGTDRDVTRLTTFLTSNSTSARVSASGRIEAAERGEAFVTARFDAFTVGTEVVVIPRDLEFEFPEVPGSHFIDRLIHDKLRKLRIAPSPLAGDAEFLRRVSLDITGSLPTAERVREFVANGDPDKREKLVDELLERKEFVEMWVMKWAELLQVRSSNQVSYKAMLLYYGWLQEQIASNRPMNELVQELLASTGGTFTSPATNYYQNERETLKVAENVAQVFLGMRIQCAQCHNHPFDRWTQDDYYGFAAFFSQIGRKRGEDPRETIVFDRRGGDVRHPVGGRVMAPKFLGGETPETRGRDRREVLAEWLASDRNPYFATNLANIVWAHFFGRGIIHEIDDVRVTNPPVNRELLEELGRRFREYGYDFKKLVRDICTSRTYQLSSTPNASNRGDETNFSHQSMRRLRAEVLLDCISSVTETTDKFRGLPRGARALQIADGTTSTYFLKTFGRASRETVCSCEVKMEPNLSQALHLLNGDTVHQKIRQGGVIPRLLKSLEDPAKVIEELYLRCLSRPPTPAETARLTSELGKVPDPRPVLEDIFWALLNSREFLFNH